MSDKPIFVTQPALPPLDEFISYLQEIWESRILTNGGPHHQMLEEELCKYLGVKHISLFANGTLALIAALRALNITGEVITTPYSFVATSQAIKWNQNKPVFVDVDSNNFNLDPAKIKAAITSRTSAIVPVHCYGNPCDVEEIQQIADDHNLKVIYDAAHAFGVECHCGSVLNHGDLSVLSFHATKVFNTFEGGAIVCHDSQTKQHIDELKNFALLDETTVNAIGINAKMSELNSAFGRVQLKHVSTFISRRGAIDSLYRELLVDVEGIRCVPLGAQVKANYSYFPILVESSYGLSRDGLYNKLKKHGINTRRYFYPLIPEFPAFYDRSTNVRAQFPTASFAAEQVLCIPIYPDLSEQKVYEICQVISKK